MRGCCMVLPNELEFEHAYTVAMVGSIKAHFGRDILAECEEAARYETGTPKKVEGAEEEGF